ncbi:hypothetical protein HHK36_020149 [Tetracentron sinense]|uniref:Gnk2-homologous domain-containing protein n=1 Tax=Tetracentron sinense TaxID=13715 RepID=A0A835DAP1_TETSI|nr:hypothetical protein HHK36_020149 [Tetracentron sinense]
MEMEEKGKEKKQQWNTETQRSSIPHDLMVEIFLRTPCKSLLRFSLGDGSMAFDSRLHPRNRSMTYFDGALYFLAENNPPDPVMIVALDVGDENFRRVQPPCKCGNNPFHVSLVELNENLCLADKEGGDSGRVVIWVLKDCMWIKKYSISFEAIGAHRWAVFPILIRDGKIVFEFKMFVHDNRFGDRLGEFCNKESNISSNSQISANIDHLLAELESKAASNGFIATSYGKATDQVYGLAQCRGDVSTKDCSSCVNDAAKQIRELCPNQADARIWFDYCFLRYDIKDFIGELDTSFGIFYWNVENVTDPEAFEKDLGALMDQVRSQAVKPNNGGLGKGETKLSPFVTLYALVQCTRDLSQLSCAQCLAIAVGNFPNFCRYKKGCRVLYSSCYVRYEIYPFFFPLESDNTPIGITSRTTMYP